jgi:hypothetical protein
VVGELEVSLTVVVSVTGDPGFTADELGDTVTVVESVLLETGLLETVLLETDVLLLSVNIILLLSAIAGRIVKPPKIDELNMQEINKN